MLQDCVHSRDGQAADRRDYWEKFFAAGEDPWRYDNPYEAVKYRQTLELLPPEPIGAALELGCAEGTSRQDWPPVSGVSSPPTYRGPR